MRTEPGSGLEVGFSSQLQSEALYTDAHTEVASSNVSMTGFPPPLCHREAPASRHSATSWFISSHHTPALGGWGLILLICTPTPCRPCSKNQAELKTDS